MASIPLELLLTVKNMATAELKKVEGGLSDLGKIALGGVVAGVGALAVGLIAAGKAAAEEEVGIAKLGAAVKASGGNWDTASGAIEAYLAAELRRTALDDGEGREAISRLTTATGSYEEAISLMGLAQDLSAAKGISLASAAEIVGKVSNGNTAILARYGIEIDKNATSTEALGLMQATFAGQAEAYGNTNEGAQKKLDIAMGNLKETVGTLVLPIMTQMALVLSDLAMRAMPILENAIEAARPVFEAVFTFIRETVVPILSNIIGWVVTNWPTISSVISAVLGVVWDILKTVFGWIRDYVIPILGTVINYVIENWPLISENISEVAAEIMGIWEVVSEAAGDLVKMFTDTKTDVVDTWDAISAAADTTWQKIKAFVVDPITEAKNIVTGLVADILRVFGSINIQMPHINLPHVNVNWSWVGAGGIGIWVPSLDVQWYAKGLNNALFTSPTLIGVGEAGAERVTITPAGGSEDASGATWSLTYIDQRVGGGVPDLIRVARGLEWRMRMGAA